MLRDYQKLEHGTSTYGEYFVVNWCFFSICNFKCTYCPDNLHDGKFRGLPIETVKSFCKKVIDSKPDKKIFFEFTGGEVTYYKDFIPLFEYLKSLGAETGLISNGSRDLAYWEKHKHLIDHICLSFHPEGGDMDHFFEVVKILNEVTTVHVNIMMLPEQFSELYAFGAKIAAEIDGPSIALQALFENMSGVIFNYSPEEKRILDTQDLPWGKNIKFRGRAGKTRKVYRGEMKKIYADGKAEKVNPPELIARGENNWVGWDCNIGLENLVVDLNGNVLRGWCGVGGVIGNVSDEDFQMPTRPILCTSRNCFCGFDIMATKSAR
ncbi:MAG: radical SAM protein [Bdellovibrionota bacterium]